MATTDRTLAALRPAHRKTHALVSGDASRWFRAQEIGDDVFVSRDTVYRVLGDLERLGVVDVRLCAGGFQEWRHREASA
jgi:hypothetical protein